MHKIINFLVCFLLNKTVDNIHFLLYNYTIDKKLKGKYIMKNNNKTLKRLTATFLTATSIFNFTVPGKAEMVNFQEDGSIRYGKGNDKTISAEDLGEIREKIKKEFDATKFGREYIDPPTCYNTCNFRAKISVSGISPENIGGYTKCRTDKEFVFEYSGIKDVYIIYSVDGSIEKDQHNEVESDKNGGYFNPFDPEHEDSIFLVIAPDTEWKKMEKVYEQKDVKNKFIRFESIYDTGKTLNLDITVGVDDGNNTKKYH